MCQYHWLSVTTCPLNDKHRYVCRKYPVDLIQSIGFILAVSVNNDSRSAGAAYSVW